MVIFQRLKFSLSDLRFLAYSRYRWCSFDSWKKLKRLTSSLRIFNDVTERGVKLMKKFKDVITNNEEERKFILHCIEDIRKLYLHFRKSTLVVSN